LVAFFEDATETFVPSVGADLHRGLAGAHDLRDFLKRKSLEPVEVDHLPLGAGEGFDRGFHLSDPLLADGVIGLHERVAPAVEVERSFGASAAPTEVIASEIQADREDPRAEELPVAEILARAVEVQERLLHDVGRVVGGGDVSPNRAKEPRRIALEETTERVVVPRAIREHQGFVGRFGVGQGATAR
jgi:hypothetical protein